MNFVTTVKELPVLIRSYITPHILRDFWQFVSTRGKAITRQIPLEVHIVEHCNLNCKGCSHFSPLAKEEYLPLEAFEKDMARLKDLKARFLEVKLLGGEPLLHPDIVKFCRVMRRYFPKTNVQITTNGILLPKMPEEFWKTCHEERIRLSVSQYPIKIDRPAIKALAKKYQVKLEYIGSSAPDRFVKMPLDIEGRQNARLSWKNCMIAWGPCITLRNGRIYPCLVLAHIRFINEYFGKQLEVTKNDYIDIHQAQSWSEILSFLKGPYDFCRYCATRNMQYGIPWGISKKELSEWI
jgi:MoaA/NifB/PqqE/SkfB family radical SAM enzyme